MPNYKQIYELAKHVAMVAHMGQTDKGGNPYIEHPLAVSKMVSGQQAKIVALLHDVIEDSPYTENTLRVLGIPEEIVTAVVAISRKEGESLKAYLCRVKANELARQVKIADLQHNSDLSRIPDPTEKDKARTERYLISMQYLQKEE